MRYYSRIRVLLQHWFMMRPRRLSERTNVPIANLHIARLKCDYEELCIILQLKRKPKLYYEPRLTYITSKGVMPTGVHNYGLFQSTIVLADRQHETPFYLAHEMFHEYQREYCKEVFNDSLLEQEAQADAFALAYCESHGFNLEYGKFMNNDGYCAALKDTKNEEGIPELIRSKAEEYKKQFDM